MFRKGSRPGPSMYSYGGSLLDAGFIDKIAQTGDGPSPLLFPLDQRKRIIRQSLLQQDRVLTRLNAAGIIAQMNADLLHNSGTLTNYFSAVDRIGDITSTGQRLILTAADAPQDGSVYDPIALKLRAPSVMIGLFGDARKMRRGEPYMSYLAVVSAKSSEQKDIDAALGKSHRAWYKLTSINPNLDVTQFSSGKWERLQRKANRRARKQLKELLNENKEVRLAEQHIRDAVITTGGIILGAVVAKGVSYAVPIVEDHIKNVIHHFVK